MDQPLTNRKQKMDSLDKECNELKHAYDSCFNTWFADSFLKGSSKDSSPCEAMLKAYSKCVQDAMKKRSMDPDKYLSHWDNVSKEEKVENKQKRKEQASHKKS